MFSIAAHKGGVPEMSVFRTRHFQISFAYLVIFAIGVALVCYIIEPDWMWMYFLDYRKIPTAVVVYAFCFYPLLFCLGYLAAPELEKIRPRLANRVYQGINVVIVVVIIAFIHRLWHVGTFEQYAAGPSNEAPDLITLKPFRMLAVGWVLAAATPIVGGSLIWLYRKISREATLQKAKQA